MSFVFLKGYNCGGLSESRDAIIVELNTIVDGLSELLVECLVSMDPSWHHNYASVAWFNSKIKEHKAHYPSIKPDLVELTTALHALAHDREERNQFRENPRVFADRFNLSVEQREALINLDINKISKMGTHPLIPFLAHLNIEFDGKN